MCLNNMSPVDFCVIFLSLTIHSTKSTNSQLKEDIENASFNDYQTQSIRKYMDLSMNPCVDFWQYSCKNWRYHHNSNHYSEAVGYVDYKVNTKFEQFFNSYQLSESGNSIKDKVWTYYQACVSKKASAITYLKMVRPGIHIAWPIFEYINNKTASISESQKWLRNKESFHWLLSEARVRRYGLKSLFLDHTILHRPEDQTKLIVHLSKPSLEISNVLHSSKLVNAILKRMGLPKHQYLRVTDQYLKFQKKHDFLVKKFEEQENENVAPLMEFTVGQEYANQPWRQYFSIVLGRKVRANFKFQISNIDYFDSLFKLLEKTDPEVICNYIMIKFLNYLLVDGRWSNSSFDCIVDVRNKMDIAMNYIYYENFYKHKDYANYEVSALFQRIHKEFLNKVHENKLGLSPNQIRFLYKKMMQMRLNIGNLPLLINEYRIQKYYRDVFFKSTDYNFNHLSILSLLRKRDHERLYQNITDPMSVLYVTDRGIAESSTPFYLVRYNMVVVPYSLLQPPMFDKRMHDVFKFSLLGFLISHEIVHGFDVTSLDYDEMGNLADTKYNITENTRYKDGIECLVENQETESIDERLADVVGLRLAFDAMFKGNDTMMKVQPEFSQFSLRRLFFLNFAQFFCGNLNEDNDEEHDTDDIRLRQAVRNFQPFAEEFNCIETDQMNPVKKCRLY